MTRPYAHDVTVPAPLLDAVERVRTGLWPTAQCAVAAALAWLLADELLGHNRPYFAAVAALVCLGVRQAQRLRRVAELAAGVTVGVLVGELLAGQIGPGAWQVGLVVGIALLLALVVGGGALVTNQAGLQAVIVVALPHEPGAEIARWQDAMVGGLVALVVAALVPTDPWRPARRAAVRAIVDTAAALREGVKAVRRRSAGGAADGLARARATQSALTAWEEQLATGRDVSALSPFRRSAGKAYAARAMLLVTGVDRTARNVRVLLRRLLAALELREELPVELADLLDGLADLLDQLADDPDGRELEPAVRAYAARLDLDALGLTMTLSVSVVLAQLRFAVVDLLEGIGLDHETARQALPPLRT
jgi:uncharacterized membrane protein YgaE (UPF0421/DUF939 family)